MYIFYLILNILIGLLLIFFGFLFKTKTYNERLLYEVVNIKPIYNYTYSKLNIVCILLGSILLLSSSYFLFISFNSKS
jgi:hypothetical protein